MTAPATATPARIRRGLSRLLVDLDRLDLLLGLPDDVDDAPVPQAA